MPDALDELLDFLADKRAGMRARAAGVIQGLTAPMTASPLIERKQAHPSSSSPAWGSRDRGNSSGNGTGQLNRLFRGRYSGCIQRSY